MNAQIQLQNICSNLTIELIRILIVLKPKPSLESLYLAQKYTPWEVRVSTHFRFLDKFRPMTDCSSTVPNIGSLL